jgi:hypothetical protein
MRRRVADWLNERGRTADDTGHADRARRYYRLATKVDLSWSVPFYNLGLLEKYARRWEDSLRHNQNAAALDPKDEAAWWNLGIAATALRNWPEARRAWHGFGIDIPDGTGVVEMPVVAACVRLNPNGDGEVVWGDRIDPARIVLLNVPLAESGHRFHDIVLHDGAQNGSRMRDGREYPVFDALSIWQPSDYSTFEVSLNVPNQSDEDRLVELCREYKIGVEDWSTVDMICAECSRGNPGPHDCKRKPESTNRKYALAAKSEDELQTLLTAWAAEDEIRKYEGIKLVLPAVN